MNPAEFSKRNSVIKLSAESLDLVTKDGKPSNNGSCTILFKVEVFGNSQSECFKGCLCLVSEFFRTLTESNVICLDSSPYEVEWSLLDPQTHNPIPDGDYEIPFTKSLLHTGNMLTSEQFPWMLKFFKKKSLSSDLSDRSNRRYLDITAPKIKVHLNWPKDFLSTFNGKENMDPKNAQPHRKIYTRSHSTGNISSRRSSSTNGVNCNAQQITYRFIYENYIQKTETWNRLICPWCSLKCIHLYILLKHLSLCHSYFKFIYVPCANETRIDVKLRKSDSKNEFDPFSPQGTSFDGHEPKKRCTMTEVLVCHPERQKPHLVEFTLSYNGASKKRKYFHSVTGLPVLPAEMDQDSEDEKCPDWLMKHTNKQIDDFIDVNSGETGIMKLWSFHIQRHSYIGNVQIPDAVRSFIVEYGALILEKKLYRNCLLHFTLLSDCGLLSASEFYDAICRLQLIICSHEAGRNAVKKGFEEQQEHSAKMFKKPVEAPKSPNVPNKIKKKYQRVNYKKIARNNHGLRSQSRKLRRKSDTVKKVVPQKLVRCARKYSASAC